MLEYDDPELRSWFATLDADPRVEWVEAQRDRLAVAWESGTITEPKSTAFEFDTISEPLGSRSTRSRRGRRTAIMAAAVVLAMVALIVAATLPGIDGRGVQTPRRPAPTTIPNISKTHAIVVTPSTRLRDRQIVRVSSGFVPAMRRGGSIDPQKIVVQICRVGVTPQSADFDCDRLTTQGTWASQAATVPFRQYPYMVRRIITVGGNTPQPRRLDCAAAPGCVLYAVRDAGGGPARRTQGAIRYRRVMWGVAPLVFDRAASPLPGPSVTLTPPGALRDGATVTVQGRHFRPVYGRLVNVCVSGTELCVSVRPIQIDANGSFSVTVAPLLPPRSVFAAYDGTLQDCHVVTCVIRVRTPFPAGFDMTGETVDVPVSFAPAGTTAYP